MSVLSTIPMKYASLPRRTYGGIHCQFLLDARTVVVTCSAGAEGFHFTDIMILSLQRFFTRSKKISATGILVCQCGFTKSWMLWPAKVLLLTRSSTRCQVPSYFYCRWIVVRSTGQRGRSGSLQDLATRISSLDHYFQKQLTPTMTCVPGSALVGMFVDDESTCSLIH